MVETKNIGKFVKSSFFSTKDGSSEFFLLINSQADVPFKESLKGICKDYKKALAEHGLSSDSQIFSRYYLSDIANQKVELGNSEIFKLTQNGAYSVIQQCPLNGGNVSLFVYHIKGKKGAFKKEPLRLDEEHWRNGVKLSGEHYNLFWAANFSGYGALDSYEQTNEVFTCYNELINNNGMTLSANTVRTWIYVRDIDNHYQGMADFRTEYFHEQGLSQDTRYIASTGIEAKLKEAYSLVSLDALSISNLKEEQIVRMEALDNLCPTLDYGITFERGTKVQFGDRSHLFISGTASIDKSGEVLYSSDVRKQTKRTLENIEALLKPHGATLKDMAYLLVYIRNITEVNKVKEILHDQVSEEIPIIIAEGAVCRPTWLVEIEGVGIIPQNQDFPNYF